ncbi:MAG: alpha/beta hydrolase [Candidatus Nanopelagicales bacterium]|nr:alpha/beta hydrolase [Candidatus Nanopelagicales bacterium]MDZ4248532.1 alpha/beta hydrolase [Candidatus Nanopelagicales bacterium]
MSEHEELLPGITIEPKVIQTALGPVEYDLSPGDGPVILCSHGGLGGVDQARLMLDWLDPAEYRLLSVSRPGYLGTPLESGAGIEDQADLFAALLDVLNVDRVAVVSASAGGPPGYMFAVRHPDRVWAMVAIDAVSGFYDMPETAGAISQAIFTTSSGQRLLKVIGEKKPEWFLQEIFKSEGYFTKDQIKAHIERALRSPQAVEFVRAFMNTMSPYGPRKAGTENDMALFRTLTHLPVEQVQCPSLIVHGTHDADVKFYDGVYAYEHIPGAERFWVEEGSHLGFWLSPHAEEAQAAAREFLTRHQPAV